VLSASDGSGWLMEVELLGFSSVLGLDYQVSSEEVKVSSIWQSRYNIECSVNIKTEVSVELILAWFFLPITSIDKLPLLVDSSMQVPHENISVL
jgi:hypothetical protein